MGLFLFWISQEFKPFFGVGVCVFVEWGVVDSGRRARYFAVVGGRVKIYYVEAGFEEVDAGNE